METTGNLLSSPSQSPVMAAGDRVRNAYNVDCHEVLCVHVSQEVHACMCKILQVVALIENSPFSWPVFVL